MGLCRAAAAKVWHKCLYSTPLVYTLSTVKELSARVSRMSIAGEWSAELHALIKLASNKTLGSVCGGG